ncbi:uncharacterized protein BBOV_IV004440 [Babesia bovis T2Bo]|uniref:Trs120/TRAPPC9 first Ig-like domain-containing protein n=1 Tax=Babesia bovis TaxID=5865 RepID=A7AQI6_BABBO|nr:uncharacterized protein BBOV_IV004440 [Babesia bovis T2Bo]EDO06805.1 hypothetical protein BBOV_IV004440 [Babesia bovis T2Bo]|eukprot:XP_001610373.1 hypothetical protein [Babesia bovis T2Bo]
MCNSGYFGRPLSYDEALDALTCINILVCRTSVTSEACYTSCLSYLREHMSSLSLRDLRATQPSYDCNSSKRHHERFLLSLNQSEKMSIAAEIEASYISAHSVSRSILFPDLTSTIYGIASGSNHPHIRDNSRFRIRYIQESDVPILDRRLFSQGSIAAAVVIHDVDVVNSQSLRDIFYCEFNRVYDYFGTSIVHMLCCASLGFGLFSADYLRPLYPWLKYNRTLNKLKVDTSIEGFSSHTLNNAACRELIVLYSTDSSITYFLRELVIHCIVTVLGDFLKTLSTSRLAEGAVLTQYDEHEFVKNLPKKQRLLLSEGRTLKVQGDILMMLDNIPQSISLYKLARKRSKSAGDSLFYAVSGFCMAIALSRQSVIRKLELNRSHSSSGSNTKLAVDSRCNELHDSPVTSPKDTGAVSKANLDNKLSHKTSVHRRLFIFRKPSTAPRRRRTHSNGSSSQSSEGDAELHDDELFETPVIAGAGYITTEVKDAILDAPVIEVPASGTPDGISIEGIMLPSRGEQYFKSPSTDEYVDKMAEITISTYIKSLDRLLSLGTVPLRELGVLIPLMLHYLRDSGRHTELHRAIACVISFSASRLQCVDSLNLLRYFIEFTRDGPFYRKWTFYNYLYNSRRLEHGCDGPCPNLDNITQRYGLVTSLGSIEIPDSTVDVAPYLMDDNVMPMYPLPSDPLEPNLNRSFSAESSTRKCVTRGKHGEIQGHSSLPAKRSSSSHLSSLTLRDVPLGVHDTRSSGSASDIHKFTYRKSFSSGNGSGCPTLDESGYTLGKSRSKDGIITTETSRNVLMGMPSVKDIINNLESRRDSSCSISPSAVDCDAQSFEPPCDGMNIGNLLPRRMDSGMSLLNPDSGIYISPEIEHLLNRVALSTSRHLWLHQHSSATDTGLGEFPAMFDATTALSMRECELHGQRLSAAHLALIRLLVVADQVCTGLCNRMVTVKHGGSSRYRHKKPTFDHTTAISGFKSQQLDLETSVSAFTAACNLVATGTRAAPFRCSHLILSTDTSKALDFPMRGYRPLLVPLKTCDYTLRHVGDRLLYVFGGHGGSRLLLPIVTSIAYQPDLTHDIDVIHVKTGTSRYESTRPRHGHVSSDYVFGLLDNFGYRSKVVPNFSRCQRMRRLHQRRLGGPDGTSAHESSVAPDLMDTSCNPVVTLHSHKYRCRVVNRSARCGSRCRLRKVCHGTFNQGWSSSQAENSDSHDSTPSDNSGAIGIETNTVHTIRISLCNPLPMDIILRDVTVLTCGVPVESLTQDVLLPALAKRHEFKLHIIPRTAGILDIIGVRFVLFNGIESSQLLLNVDTSDVIALTSSMSGGSWSMDIIRDLCCSGAGLRFNISYPIYKIAIGYQTSKIGVVSSNRFSVDQLCTSRMPMNSSGIERLRSRSISVSIVSRCTPRVTSEYDSTHPGVRIPLSSDASLPQTLRLCCFESCWICTVTRQKSNEFMGQKSPKLELIEGEERLIHLMLYNSSGSIMLYNFAVSVLPVLDEPDVLCDAMTLRDRELATARQRTDSVRRSSDLSRHFKIFSDRAMVISSGSEAPLYSYRSRSSDISSARSLNSNSGDVVLLYPGSTLYIPIVYRASVTDCRFHVRVDYEYNSGYGPVRATVYKLIDVSVSKGLSIGKLGMSVQPRIEFDLRTLLSGIQPLLSPVTMQYLQSLKSVFDGHDVDIEVSIANDTDRPFMCMSGSGVSKGFVALPRTDATWRIRSQRLLYMAAKQMTADNFVQLLDHHLALRWSLGSSREGELRISDLSHQRDRMVNTSAVVSKATYRRSVMSQYTRVGVWRLKSAGRPLPLYGFSRVPEVVLSSLHCMVESRISLDICISLGSSAFYSTSADTESKFCVRVPLHVRFNISVYARNNGDSAVEDYLTCILPFNPGTYTRPYGISWTGSLEQLGIYSLLPGNRISPRSIAANHSTNGRPGEDTLPPTCLGGQLQVAHMSMVARETCVVGLTACIVVRRDSAVYWHHRPVFIQVVPAYQPFGLV